MFLPSRVCLKRKWCFCQRSWYSRNSRPTGSVAEWSARRTRNPVVPGSSPALATCWICSRSSRAQILGHACKWPTGCLLPVGVLNPVMLYLNYLFSKYSLIVKRFGSLRERRYISVYYYYYYYYYLSTAATFFWPQGGRYGEVQL